MIALLQTYIGLLADVARLTGFSEIRGSIVELQWCLNEAPKLEKHVLDCIENDREVELDRFPKQLRRLASVSRNDPHMLRFLRQLLLFSYKAHVQHDKTKTAASFNQFVETNSQVGAWGNALSERSPLLLDLARTHVQSVLYAFRERDVIPFHGPGASTTPKDGKRWSKWYESIECCYPYSDYYSLYFNSEQQMSFGDLTSEHIQADLIAVPKDSRGPRLICVHPAEAIWLQQGIRVELERAIGVRRTHPGPWPKGYVQFDDQSINGNLALLSSMDRKFATLDMKEASDRISEPLVQILFGRKYKWFGSCRAQRYHVKDPSIGIPDGDINCYAPMGNATTFPVQSLVFWAICCASLQHHGFHQPGVAFVFGDDIIVPTEAAQFVIDDLESFGLLVNRTKSFWRGGFRESCGVDAFNGIDVTPVRWKTRLDAEGLSGLQSLSDMAMRLRIAGYWEASVQAYALLHRKAKQYFKVPIALTNDKDHGGIAEYSECHSLVWRDAYWHLDTQQYVSPVVRVQEPTRHRDDRLCGWNHVLESVCSLERTGRSNVPDRRVSRRAVLNRGWIPVR
jgi:hypothetical protein